MILASSNYFYLFAILAGIMASVGDSFLNEWAKKGTTLDSLIAGIIFWNISLVFFVLMTKRGLFSDSVVYFVVANFLVSVAISTIYFHEDISSLKGFGIVLALCSIIAISLG